MRHFQLAALHLLLTFDAEARPGHGFQALGIDIFTAGNALAEVAFPHTGQSTFHHLQ